MAHHNSTPQSVLDAPVSRPEPLVYHDGATRQERRHGLGVVMKVTDQLLYMRTKNHPHASAKVRKIRKGRKARFNRSAA